jgi:transposase
VPPAGGINRDARNLARLFRAGELTAIYVPDPTDEAIRDLCRARTDAVDDCRRNRQRLKRLTRPPPPGALALRATLRVVCLGIRRMPRLLLRNGYRYQGKANWSQAHMRYLRELVLPDPAQKVILEDYLMAIEVARMRVERYEQTMRELLETWRLRPAVEALMAFKGFQVVAAMITVSELGNVLRFDHARQVMGYLGLTPTEHTTGTKRRQGGISRCGNGHLRWLLVECASHYATPPKVSKELSRRQEGVPHEILATSWKAQNRLHVRFNRLLGRKVPRNSRGLRRGRDRSRERGTRRARSPAGGASTRSSRSPGSCAGSSGAQ